MDAGPTGETGSRRGDEYAMSQSTRTMSETRCLALQGKQRGPSMDRRGLAPTFIICLRIFILILHIVYCLIRKGMGDLLSFPPALWTGCYAIRLYNMLAKLLTTILRQTNRWMVCKIFFMLSSFNNLENIC
jgi:hypothetical protein